ncbi:MAG: O-antigen ligase family protein [Bacteroidaceae bacterium]|jgi:O-antigen ligase|nr:O-antigen ligase family protein [Bacteroidaceae bacterium]
MSITTSNNKYDVYIILIILSTIYGRWGFLHPTTFLGLYFLPQLLEILSSSNIMSKIRPFWSFFMFWLVYALVSFAWTPRMSDGIRDFVLLFIHFLLFIEILVFSTKANSPIQSIVNGWVFAFLCTAVIAMGEIVFGQHLSSARIESDAFVESRGDTYATVTFYNPNTYCYFMSLSFPFILYYFSQSKSWANIGIILLAIFIMTRNSSRGGLITLLLMSSVYMFYKMKSGSVRKKVFIIILVSLLLLLVIAFGAILFSTAFNRIGSAGLLNSNARILLIIWSWELFVDSYGFGQGVGSMLYELEHIPSNFTELYCAHNMIMEILLEYGLVIALVVIYFLWRLYKNAKKITEINMKSVLMGAVISFPFYSIINSENLRPHFIWVFFATIYVLSLAKLKKEDNDESLICN